MDKYEAQGFLQGTIKDLLQDPEKEWVSRLVDAVKSLSTEEVGKAIKKEVRKWKGG